MPVSATQLLICRNYVSDRTSGSKFQKIVNIIHNNYNKRRCNIYYPCYTGSPPSRSLSTTRTRWIMANGAHAMLSPDGVKYVTTTVTTVHVAKEWLVSALSCQRSKSSACLSRKPAFSLPDMHPDTGAQLAKVCQAFTMPI